MTIQDPENSRLIANCSPFVPNRLNEGRVAVSSSSVGMRASTTCLESLAAAGDYLTAKAAYEVAVKRRPGEPIMLRDWARVILKSS